MKLSIVYRDNSTGTETDLYMTAVLIYIFTGIYIRHSL